MSGNGSDLNAPDLNGWGIDNDYGVLRDVLLGKPDHFEWRPISQIAKRTFNNLETLGITYNHQLAQRQHREMVDIYEANGVTVHLLDADEGLPCSVYARDSSAMTPWGALVTSIQTPFRRRDYSVVTRFYNRMNIPIWNWVTAGHFEGGDFDIIEPGAVLLGYCGERSEEDGARQVAKWVEAEGWDCLVAPIPVAFVHMDGMVVMVGHKTAVACVDALEDYVIDWITARGIEIIPVGYREASRLGCNVVALGDDRVLSMATNADLNQRLEAMGFEVFTPDMSMFQHGGGGVHCLSQALRRDPVEGSA
ncbi:MAG: arginine deiminase family protein [Pseudomonadota bacterium]|nr:arginine deiminase family protein [Pseudomonadota bacterium]